MKQNKLGTGSAIWGRVAGVMMVLFFVYLADAIMSDWVPGYVQGALHSPLAMGMVMAFSSVVGFVADLLFPQILTGTSVRRLLFFSIGSSVLFAAVMMRVT